ncbi:hypothetical protein BVZ28_12405 [Alcaligenes faecalis]|uniref:hypothetical protein n=1 Tax=Alcaligenes faecalis TaxID=511 RepID=UPI000A2D53C7|nr:hypothetical protein [Alcaligenes faecalis]OSZ33568.1 hypothetical protein BVZ28_12405 [Alcaligenes faecalis]OSZ47541.1 hypothetical protein BVZ29_01495 [Alcaligenes faecalis]
MTAPDLPALTIPDEHTVEPCHFEPVDTSSSDETVDAAAEIAAFVSKPTCSQEHDRISPETRTTITHITNDKSPFSEAAGL